MEDTPFSKDYVIKLTLNNMKRSINKSIDKSHARLEDKPEQSLEIMETISDLLRIKKVIEEIEAHNPQITGDK